MPTLPTKVINYYINFYFFKKYSFKKSGWGKYPPAHPTPPIPNDVLAFKSNDAVHPLRSSSCVENTFRVLTVHLYVLVVQSNERRD